MAHRVLAAACAVAVVLFGNVTTARAQVLGTFRWQLQPYCNVLTMTVTQVGGVYRVEGSDDVCGAGKSASAIGTAYLNPDGSVGFGISVVPPLGPALQITASAALPALNGTWSDSEGNAGTFTFTSGAGTGGSARPTSSTRLTGVNVGGGLILAPSTGPGGEPVRTLLVDSSFVRNQARVRFPGFENTALGEGAMNSESSEAAANTAIGVDALRRIGLGDWNIGIGNRALRSTTSGSYNIGIGGFALYENMTGSQNTAVGVDALTNTTASDNTAIGRGAMKISSTGERNVAVGVGAGAGIGGDDNIMIGYNAGSSTASSGFNNIYIGAAGFQPDVNTIRIGNPAHSGAIITGIAGQTTVGGVNVLINAGGRLGTVTSSGRFKTDVADVATADLLGLQVLRPVRFHYKPEYGGDGRELQYGLIAEEVAATMPDLVARDESGAPWSVRYQLLAPLLVADAQRLERERRAMSERIELLEAERDALQTSVAELARRLTALERAASPR